MTLLLFMLTGLPLLMDSSAGSDGEDTFKKQSADTDIAGHITGPFPRAGVQLPLSKPPALPQRKQDLAYSLRSHGQIRHSSSEQQNRVISLFF